MLTSANLRITFVSAVVVVVLDVGRVEEAGLNAGDMIDNDLSQ